MLRRGFKKIGKCAQPPPRISANAFGGANFRRSVASTAAGVGQARPGRTPYEEKSDQDVRFGSLADINASDEKGPLSGLKQT